ncbi:MAG: hypothetical protein ACLSB7_00525 [Parabacteroides distasonis]
MDSISLIAKDPSFPLIDSKKYPDIFFLCQRASPTPLSSRDESAVLSKYDCMSVGEGSAVMVDDVAKFVDPAREELNMLIISTPPASGIQPYRTIRNPV